MYSSVYSGGMILLNILPSEGDEEQKIFTVNLTSASNDVEINPDKQSVTITIAERGMPYGTISFFGDVIQLHKVDEGIGNQSIVFPIARSAPALGDVEVSFTVSGIHPHYILTSFHHVLIYQFCYRRH